jgi:hypothetical protein
VNAAVTGESPTSTVAGPPATEAATGLWDEAIRERVIPVHPEITPGGVFPDCSVPDHAGTFCTRRFRS